MDLVLYLILPALLTVGGGAAMVRRNHAGDPEAKLRCGRAATAFFGSAGIIWLVYLLAPVLQFLVIAVAIAFYLRWLLWGRTSIWFLRYLFSRRS